MDALRLNNRQESYQTMCTHGHEYQNNGLDVRSSVIINRLPTPVVKNNKMFGIGNQLVACRFVKYEN